MLTGCAALGVPLQAEALSEFKGWPKSYGMLTDFTACVGCRSCEEACNKAIGLLGTVLGVIKAFHGLGTLGSTGAEVVMRSISKALLATAAGLFIAIPVVMANNYFSKKVKIIIQQLEILSREISASLHVRKPAAEARPRTKKR
jgi:ferredoxin